MPDSTELDHYYKSLNNQELLSLRTEGGFTADAEQVIDQELARRNLGPAELKHHAAAAEHDRLRDEATERGGGYRMPGLQFFGKRYLNEADRRANIQVRTKWFTMSGIPLVPLASYRFKCNGGSDNPSHLTGRQTVINRVPLDWKHVILTWFKTVVILLGAMLVVVTADWLIHLRSH